MRKSLYIILVCFIMVFVSPSTLHAKGDTLRDDETYHVVNVDKNGTYEIIGSYDTYAEAKVIHTLKQSKYLNLGITYGASFMSIDQGVVAFNASACDVNTEYNIDGSGDSGYLNGCYGNDAVFLEYNTATNKVKFKISGVVAWVDASLVNIYPFQSLPSVSSFVVKDGVLYHHLKSNATSSTYANTIALSDAPDYLKEDTTYYSYDTHYFYTSYKAMSNDYRNGTYTKAINTKTPYYNYYQYMDHRSSSAYTPKQLNSYLKDTLGLRQTILDFYDKDNYIHDVLTQSLLVQGSDAFFQYQNEYGANAIMMFSLSLNESALGRSYLAYTKNNLFGHAAYDSSAEESASRYQSVASSIHSHALNYISKSYLNPEAFQFYGGFFGNKAGGMNVAYASDPYWGEKAAQYYYRTDSALGSKDYQQYALGISEQNSVNVYKSASDKADILYSIEKGYDGSFILLEKIKNKSGSWYRVQSDLALDKDKKIVSDGSYAFTTSYGYVKASDISTVSNSKQMEDKNYVTLTFHAKDGTFYPQQKIITMEIENGMTPVIEEPTKKGYLFDGWDIKLEPANNNLTYNATYKEVKSIQLIEKPQSEYNVGDTLNLKDGKIRIEFKDGKSKEVALTTDMVSGFRSDSEGKQTLSITYGGNTTHYEINISKSQDDTKQELLERAAYIIKTYSGKTGLSEEAMEDITRFRDDMKTISSQILTRDQIRVIDRILQENLKPRYSVIIKDDTYDLQTSGLAFALQGESTFLNKFMPKTIKITLDDGLSDDDETLVRKIANANEMQVSAMFTIKGTDDFSSLKPKSDIVYSIKKPKEDREHRIYRIYYVDGDDVYQLATTQSKERILFTSERLGSFAVVYQTVDSVSNNEDFSEVNTIAQNGKNYIMRYVIFPMIMLILIIFIVVALWIYRKRYGLHLKKRKPKIEKERNHE